MTAAPALIWKKVASNKGAHIMKTTIEIADDLFKRAQALARKKKTTLRALTEQGLRLVLDGRHRSRGKLLPLVTVGGNGLSEAFKSAPWEQFRDGVYRGHGS
jgi:hypothetical protein